MTADALKLTIYFGERARTAEGFLADTLTGIFARHALGTSLLMRGAEGFGAKHHPRADRLLTLSDDLPLVLVAVDTRPRIEAVVEDLEDHDFSGLVTLEGVSMLAGRLDGLGPGSACARLTVYLGRHERVRGRPAHEVIVELLRRQGVAGASAVLGVDGTAGGVRRRATFFGPNAEVPMMVVSVGEAERIAAALPELLRMLERPVATLEPTEVCKRDGRRLGNPGESQPGAWRKLTVYCGLQSRHRGRPLQGQLVRALREAGAAGATSVGGVWGYHGDHPPQGDSLWRLARRVPVATVIIDTSPRVCDWFAIVDRLTDETGLVTSEALFSARPRGG